MQPTKKNEAVEKFVQLFMHSDRPLAQDEKWLRENLPALVLSTAQEAMPPVNLMSCRCDYCEGRTDTTFEDFRLKFLTQLKANLGML
jgi:hypothetical protein